ncbi:MAG: BON domain-containing protein [Bryobacterales bacterium]|nr:BON domain-containing protein [Bryobacterales bacterium]
MKRRTIGTTILAMMLAIGISTVSFAQESERQLDRLQNQIRKELVTLPFYSVFDNFEYKLSSDGTVTLLGQVHRPTLKSSAENVVKRLEGVTKVINNIEVLPVSSMDDQIRLATYRAIYGHPALQTLAIRAVPPIHIIVKNGNVTLDGVVATKLEKQVAGAQANQVSGVFSVTNNLRVEGGES